MSSVTHMYQKQMDQQLELARQISNMALKAGADQTSVSTTRTEYTSTVRRDGDVEVASASTSRGVSLSVLKNDNYSSHSTSDLRPEAIAPFVNRAIESTSYLEPDADRALPDISLMGRGASSGMLDLFDRNHSSRTPHDRTEDSLALDRHLKQSATHLNVLSRATHISDGISISTTVTSNGFAEATSDSWFGAGAELTASEASGKRPEAMAWYMSRHSTDMPTPHHIAAVTAERVTNRLNSGPAPSGKYTLVLSNRAAGQILGILRSPLAGSSLHHESSVLAGKLEQSIGSSLLTIVDDPLIPRGLGSRPWDGDGLRSHQRKIVEDGVLKQFNIGIYYGRKLSMPPTSSGSSNWVIPPGKSSWQDLSSQHNKAIRVTGFLGGNANGATGDFSFGVQGQLLENGEVVQNISEMNMTGNLLLFFNKLVDIGDDPWRWSTTLSPTLIFEQVQFSGS